MTTDIFILIMTIIQRLNVLFLKPGIETVLRVFKIELRKQFWTLKRISCYAFLIKVIELEAVLNTFSLGMTFTGLGSLGLAVFNGQKAAIISLILTLLYYSQLFVTDEEEQLVRAKSYKFRKKKKKIKRYR